MIRPVTILVTLCVLLLLTGCKSPEERAERFIRNAVERLEGGDTTQAVLEMRNALQLVPDHEQARLMLAKARMSQGETALAVREYLALVRAHPGNGAGHLALAEIALEEGDWPAVEHHVALATGRLVDTERIRAVRLALAYRGALRDADSRRRADLVAEASAFLAARPQQLALQRILIDSQLRRGDWQAALDEIDRAIDAFPDRPEFHELGLVALHQLGRPEATAPRLEEMVARFPNREDLPEKLVGWHLQQDRPEEAESFLRSRAAADPDDSARQHRRIDLIQEQNGLEAAAQALEDVIAQAGPQSTSLRVRRAAILYSRGAHDQAIAELEDLLQGSATSRTERDSVNGIRADLARMKQKTGDQAGAEALVAEILAQDPGNVAALRMRAAWQIAAGAPRDAIGTLRRALPNAPRDPTLLGLLATAHGHVGDRELQGEMLASAMVASGAAPAESLRYARYLASEQRLTLAEDMLVTALRVSPKEISLLLELGRVHVALSDWSQADRTALELKRLSRDGQNPVAKEAHDALKQRIQIAQLRAAHPDSFSAPLPTEPPLRPQMTRATAAMRVTRPAQDSPPLHVISGMLP